MKFAHKEKEIKARRLRLAEIENPARFDEHKNVTQYDRESFAYLKRHPEELHRPIKVSRYGKEDKMGKMRYFIEEGQHRHHALKELGEKHIHAIIR